jgi:hypothetical protein
MKNKFLFSLALFIFLFFPCLVRADLGPKPTMKFDIIYQTSDQITLQGGEQYQCEDKKCLNIKPLGQLGPQRFTCQDNFHCRSSAYGYDPYQKLILNFSDKTRASQIFNGETFNGTFDVQVTADKLIIKETTPLASRGRLPDFFKALIITLFLELLVAYFYLLIGKMPKKILLSVILANLISLPIVWFFPPRISLSWTFFMEIFAVVFEALFIFYLNKNFITIKKSFNLSLIMNVASLFGGWFINFFIISAFYRFF